MVKFLGIIFALAIIFTSEFASAEDTLLASAAKVILFKRQMFEDMLVLEKDYEDLDALKKFATTMKALKTELKAFCEAENNGQESLLDKISFAKVKRNVRADKLYVLGATLMGFIAQRQTKKITLMKYCAKKLYRAFIKTNKIYIH